MQGYELQRRIAEDPCVEEFFLGVFAADELKRNLRRAKPRSFCIVITDKSTEPGSHWYVVFKTSSRSCETFDSLGQSTETAKRRFGKLGQCISNVTRVQPEGSTSCGKFAAYFSVTRTTVSHFLKFLLTVLLQISIQ